jgi:hypothetical protein
VGLREMFQDLAAQMLSIGGVFDNVPVMCTYYSGTPGASADYDPLTQTVTDNETAYAIQGVIDRPQYRAIDNINVFPSDRWLYVAGQLFLQAGMSTRNKPDDRVVFQDGSSWTVVRISTDPVGAAIIIEMRSP